MATLIPVVSPANNSTGIETGITPVAIFSEAIDFGSITEASCFIIQTKHEDSFNNNLLITPEVIKSVISGAVSTERWDLLLDQPSATLDYGDPVNPNRGKLYRTRITINPNLVLVGNENYIVILSKDITKVSVFDAQLTSGSGSSNLSTKGVFTGDVNDTYNIVITNSGVNNTAKYTWTRLSDGYTSSLKDAKERFVEIDKGVKIKFGDGNFVAGNIFRIRVRPADYLNDFFAWSFSTSQSDFALPQDERSNELINLPAIGTSPTGPTTINPEFYVTKITPAYAQSLVPVPHIAYMQIGDVVFSTLENTNEFNYWTVNLKSGGSAGGEIVTLTGTDIEILMEDGESTAQQIVNIFNSSGLVNADFTAETERGTIKQEATDSKVYFSGGKNPIEIVVEFNKNINPATVTREMISIIGESLVPGVIPPEIKFNYSITNNVLTITPIEG